MYRPGRSRRPNSLRTCVRMRASADVATVLSLKATGMSASAIARRTGLPRSTVRDWMRGQVPHTSRPAPRLLPLPPPPERDYAYLLGLYLGDGCLSAHPRGVHRLRIYLDLRYPGIVEECEGAIHAVAPRNRVNRLPRRSRYTGQATATHVEVSWYSKHWAVLFPQHGPGRKHHRPIVLARWSAGAWPTASGVRVQHAIRDPHTHASGPRPRPRAPHADARAHAVAQPRSARRPYAHAGPAADDLSRLEGSNTLAAPPFERRFHALRGP